MDNEKLLERILDNQEKHGDKLDALKDDINKMGTCILETENRIMKNVSEAFVSKQEFPRLCDTAIRTRKKEGMEDFNRTTTFATNVWKWLGWIAAAAIALGAYPVMMSLPK